MSLVYSTLQFELSILNCNFHSLNSLIIIEVFFIKYQFMIVKNTLLKILIYFDYFSGFRNQAAFFKFMFDMLTDNHNKHQVANDKSFYFILFFFLKKKAYRI